MDRYAADRSVKRLARRAGVNKRISPHSLRHSFITPALDAGVPLRDVQEAASHSDLRTSMRYGRGTFPLLSGHPPKQALRAATVSVPNPPSHPEDTPLKSERERMDMIAAYTTSAATGAPHPSAASTTRR
jgi:Phage integrase family